MNPAAAPNPEAATARLLRHERAKVFRAITDPTHLDRLDAELAAMP